MITNNSKISVVIGANYGDEGKGRVVHELIDHKIKNSPIKVYPAVVRYNGGAQAGHTVCYREARHVFSHLGSGAFLGAATIFGPKFVCNPILFRKELNDFENTIFSLKDTGKPLRFISFSNIITTHMDMIVNQVKAKIKGLQNTCGVGIYETIRRYQTDPHFTYHNIFDAHREKTFELLKRYYQSYLSSQELELAKEMKIFSEDLFNKFMSDFNNFRHTVELMRTSFTDFIFNNTQFNYFVFEGAQGLKLDKDFSPGFPYTTPSNTGLKGCIEEVELIRNLSASMNLELFYVSRPYYTRHGDGVIGDGLNYVYPEEIEDKTNKPNQFQGNLRFAKIDWEKTNLVDRIMVDSFLARNPRVHLVFNCNDHFNLIYTNREREQFNNFMTNKSHRLLIILNDKNGY